PSPAAGAPASAARSAAPRPAQTATGAPAPATSTTTTAPAAPRTPIDGILDLLDGGRKVLGQSAAPPVPATPPARRGSASWLHRASRSVVEAIT
ncbi:MAG: hypothetical protein ABIS47_00785, partial [Acidimicrobiales bacterium]